VKAAYENPYAYDLTPATAAMLNALDVTMMANAAVYCATITILTAKATPTSIAGWINTPPVIGPGPFSGALDEIALSEGISAPFPTASAFADQLKTIALGMSLPPLNPTVSAYQDLITAITTGIANAWFEDWLPATTFSGGAGIGLCAPVVGSATGAIPVPLGSN
jgi:hypothetical protein